MHYWVSVYTAERSSDDGNAVLVYGYATTVRAPFRPPTGPHVTWTDGIVGERDGEVRLRRLHTYMTEDQLQNWTSLLSAPEIPLVVERLGTVRIQTGGLHHRPSVYASGREASSNEVPRSLSDQLALVEAYWQLDKMLLVTPFRPVLDQAADRGEFERVVKRLQGDTGIQFLGDQAGRLGNFEIVRYPVGSYETTDGLHAEIERTVDMSTGDKVSKTLLVWLNDPLFGSYTVGCRCFSAGVPERRTLILDKIAHWPSQCGSLLRFEAQEPITEAEVSVWNASGELVARESKHVMGDVTLDMSVRNVRLVVESPWVSSLDKHLQERASTVERVSHYVTRIGGDGPDPWVKADREGHKLVAGLISQPTEDRYFPPGSLSQVEVVEFLRDRIDRSGVKRVTIADPFFGTVGIDKLLVRLATRPSVRVITSYVKPAAGVSGGDPSDLSPETLERVCKANTALLPPLEIVSLQSPAGSAQQFHDRYLVVEVGEEREVWMLSNSLNSAAKRFPLVVTQLPEPLAGQVADYVQELAEGTPGDRPQMERVRVWTNHASVPEPPVVPEEGPRGLHIFPGWELVLAWLAPEAETLEDKVAWALKEKLLLPGAVPGRATWMVPPEKRKIVSRRILTIVKTAECPDLLLPIMAQWAYSGGLNAWDYQVDSGIGTAVQAALESWLDRPNGLEPQFAPLVAGWSLPEALEDVTDVLDYGGAWWNLTRGAEGPFLVALLWKADPIRFLSIVERRKSTRLFANLVNLVSGMRAEEPVGHLLGSRCGTLQALGVAMIWLEAKSAHQDPFEIVTQAMAKYYVAPDDQGLVLAYLASRMAAPDFVNFPGFANVARNWPKNGMTRVQRELLTLLLRRGTRDHPVVAMAELANACPVEADSLFLRELAVKHFLQRFPLREMNVLFVEGGLSRYAPGGRGAQLYPPTDEPATEVVAQQIWLLHGERALKWFNTHVLKALAIGRLREPLLRSRDYYTWSSLAEGTVWALHLGAAVVDRAPEEHRVAALKLLGERVVKVLVEDLGVEFWHYPDHSGFLAQLIQRVSRWADEPEALTIVEGLRRLATEDFVPAWWQLRLLLGSGTLLNAQHLEVEALLSVPNKLRAFRGDLADLIRELRVGLDRLMDEDHLEPALREELDRLLRGALSGIRAEQRDRPVLYGGKRRLDALRVSRFYGIAASEMARALFRDLETLRANPAAGEIQDSLGHLVGLLEAVESAGIERQAIALWLHTPNPALGTPVADLAAVAPSPWELVCAGRQNRVLELLEAVRFGTVS